MVSKLEKCIYGDIAYILNGSNDIRVGIRVDDKRKEIQVSKDDLKRWGVSWYSFYSTLKDMGLIKQSLVSYETYPIVENPVYEKDYLKDVIPRLNNVITSDSIKNAPGTKGKVVTAVSMPYPMWLTNITTTLVKEFGADSSLLRASCANEILNGALLFIHNGEVVSLGKGSILEEHLEGVDLKSINNPKLSSNLRLVVSTSRGKVVESFYDLGGPFLYMGSGLIKS